MWQSRIVVNNIDRSIERPKVMCLWVYHLHSIAGELSLVLTVSQVEGKGMGRYKQDQLNGRKTGLEDKQASCKFRSPDG